MQMAPSEFYDVASFEDVILAMKGFNDQQLEEWQRTRLTAWAAISPHLKNKTTPSQWLPLPNDVKEPDITVEEARALQQRFIDAGLLRMPEPAEVKANIEEETSKNVNNE